MKKFAFGALAVFTFIGFIATFALLYFPDIRHKSYRAFAETPQIGFRFAMRKDVVNRRFDNANVWLNRQLDFSVNVFSGQSAFFPGLMENAGYVIEQAKLPSEQIELQPFINRLAQTYPKVFEVQLWRSRALLTQDPALAIEAAEQAIALIPGDERPYRLAINSALRLHDEPLARQYCNRYKNARGGNVHPYDYNPFFYGAQLRGLLLEVVDNDGKSHLSQNEGLGFQDKIRFNFPLPQPVDIKEMRILMSTAPGVSFRVESVELAYSGQFKTISLDDLYIIPLDGFVLENSRIISTNRNGNGLSFIDKANVLTKADVISVSMSVRREPISLPEICD